MFKLLSKKNTKKSETKKETVIEKKIEKPTISVQNMNKIIDFKEKIDDLIKDFFDYDKFIKDSNDYAERDLRESTKNNIDHDFIYYHIYGDIPNYDNNVSKVDFTKDCRTFEISVTDVIDLRTSIRFLRQYIRRFETFLMSLNDIYIEYEKILNQVQNDENKNILERIEFMLSSYLTDTSYCFNIISDLLCILNNYYNKNLDSIGEKLKIVKYDTLKRYYFTHTYSLKNSVKMFNKETMIFGEINNIMKMYNYIYNFVFGTMVCDIQTIKTIFDSMK